MCRGCSDYSTSVGAQQALWAEVRRSRGEDMKCVVEMSLSLVLLSSAWSQWKDDPWLPA